MGKTQKTETGMSAAMRKAGVKTAESRMWALVSKHKDHPAAIWRNLAVDKELAIEAMRALVKQITGKDAPVVNLRVVRDRKEAIRAIVNQAKEMVKSVLERYQLLDGTYLADRQWFELDEIAAQSERQAKVVRAVKAHARVNDTSARVGDVLKSADFERIMQAIDRPPEKVLSNH